VDEKLRRSRKQERGVAERFGGRVNSQSGAGWVRKNDVTTPTSSIECKYTDKASYSLKVKDLIKAWVHAVGAGKRVVFCVEYTDPKAGYLGMCPRWVVLQEDDYLADQEELVKLRAEVERLSEELGHEQGWISI
jgi:hypothetical protein